MLLCNFLAMQHADRCASLQLTKDQSAWKSPSVLTYCYAYFLELSLLYTGETWKHIGWIKKLHQSWDFLPYLNVHNFTQGFFEKLLISHKLQCKSRSFPMHFLSLLVWQITELLPVLKIGAENNKKLSNSTLFTLGQSIKRASSVNWMEI